MASNYYATDYHVQQQYQHYDDHYHQQQYASSSSHAYDDYARQQPAEPEPELNMAGFGARRMAETSRRKAEEEDRRMREWERQQQQYEEQERMARLQWEEERRAQWEYEEEQERRRHCEQEEEEQRQREAQWYYEQRQQQQQHQQHQYDQPGYGEREPRYREESHSAAYADDMHEDPAAAAQQWYQEDHAASTSTNKQWSSDSDPIATSKDAPTFSHDDSGYAHDAAPYSSDDSGAIFKGSRLAPPGTSSSPRGSLAGIRSSLLDRRATVYEDEYEEAEDEDEDHVDITANLSRYTHYGGPADDADKSSSGDAVWSGARKSLFRNTTYQPLPKARCADCLEELDFNELADHACDQASSPATPLFALSPSARTPGSEATTPLSDVSPSSTSFFDKYATYEQERPKVAAAQEVAAMVRSSSEGDHARAKASQAGLGLGLGGVPTIPSRSNSSPSTSPSRGASPQDESIQDRRKRIEAQREAKRRAGGSSPSPSFTTSPPTTLATLVEPPSPTKPSPTKTARPQRGHSPSRNVSSSSSASSGSYSSTNSASSSAFQAPVSVSITPSSSFSHESSHDDGRCHGGSSSRDLLSPEMASGPFRKEAKKPSSGHHHHHQRSASAVAVEAARKLRLEQLAATAAAAATGTSTAANKSPRLPRKEVDLGGIEDLMETLQVDPSSDKKMKSKTAAAAAAPATSSDKPRRRANRPPQLTLSTVARHDGRAPRPTASSSSRNHPPRKCSICQCSLSTTSRTAFIEKDGNYFCASDYRDLYLPKCSKCSHPVERDAVKSSDGALRGIFHRGCFCCFDCDAPFARGVFYVWKDRPYCLDHYSKRAGTQCVSCHRGIEGVCRQTMVGDKGDKKELFHPACLRCEMDDCRQVLEDFYVVGGKRLCERHAEVVQSIVDEAVAAKVGASKKMALKKKRAEKRTTMLRALS